MNRRDVIKTTGALVAGTVLDKGGFAQTVDPKGSWTTDCADEPWLAV